MSGRRGGGGGATMREEELGRTTRLTTHLVSSGHFLDLPCERQPDPWRASSVGGVVGLLRRLRSHGPGAAREAGGPSGRAHRGLGSSQVGVSVALSGLVRRVARKGAYRR